MIASPPAGTVWAGAPDGMRAKIDVIVNNRRKMDRMGIPFFNSSNTNKIYTLIRLMSMLLSNLGFFMPTGVRQIFTFLTAPAPISHFLLPRPIRIFKEPGLSGRPRKS